jgi:preprotein translocase subunit SecA
MRRAARCSSAADIREGIHLERLGGRDPLTQFTSEAIRAFSGIEGACRLLN